MKATQLITTTLVCNLLFTGCSSTKTPLNNNCITVSSQKIQNKNYTPSKGTGIGAVAGAGTGAIIGGAIGLAGGAAVGAATSILTYGAGAYLIPLYAVSGGLVFAGIGAGAGAIIGAIGGYSYDYVHGKNGIYQYRVACGSLSGEKFYTITNGDLEIESGASYAIVDQPEDKMIESHTQVNLYSDNGEYYIQAINQGSTK